MRPSSLNLKESPLGKILIINALESQCPQNDKKIEKEHWEKVVLVVEEVILTPSSSGNCACCRLAYPKGCQKSPAKNFLN